MSSNPPGWYPDPFGRAQVRWWSGSGWTDHVATNGQQFLDQPGAGPGTAQPTGPAPAGLSAAPAVAPVVAPAAPTSRTMSATQRLMIVGVVALLVGGVIGYVARGGSSDSTSTTPAAGGGEALTTPILQGMATLDSYDWAIEATTVGPTALDRSEVSANGAADTAADTSYQKMTQTDTSADYPEASTSVTESWRSGESTCEFDGEDYTVDTRNPFEVDLGNVLSGIFDIVIPAGNAELVGTEQVAGVEAKHYTFTIEGLGAGSGTQVETNEGELWVAADGGYLLRYEVNTSMRTAPSGSAEAEEFTITVRLELTSVNQPVDIQQPSGCNA